MRVADALALARAHGLDRLDAQVLLAHRLARPRAWLIAHDDHDITADQVQAYRDDVARRADGVPLAHLVGEREFHGLRLAVSPAVLVPRPDTEVLVDWALECLAGLDRPRVLDLGTGSGAIAVSVAHARPDAIVTATDIDNATLDVARANARTHGVTLEILHGAWWQPAAGRHFELIVSNPPYIAANDPHLPALVHEPRHALTPGGDGLDALRVLAAGAPAHLVPGGQLLLEHGFDQGQAVRELLAAAGFEGIVTRLDLAGHERCSGGRRPA
jgi:release factor glutamine methyltransferase